MKKMGTLDWIGFILAIIGALNWGLVGVFKWDLIAKLFGDMTTLTRVVYTIIGVAALYRIYSVAAGPAARE